MRAKGNPAVGNCGARTGSLGKLDPSRIAHNPLAAQARSAALSRLRRKHLVARLHRLGPAPLFHFLREVENGASIPDHLERYAQIDPDFVRALGGDRFALALHVIDGGRMPERQKL
jgi:hypothetical protein